jgi:RP/EB family microtubule-associated protein
MKRVNWEAKSEFQFIENYKLLQVAFTKQNVQKAVNVDRLIRAKYQDNLEFCQWLKAFYEYVSPMLREDYDSLGRRQVGKGGRNLNKIFLPKSLKNGRDGAAAGSGRRSIRSGSKDRESVSSHSRVAGGKVPPRSSSVSSVKSKAKHHPYNTASSSSKENYRNGSSLSSSSSVLRSSSPGSNSNHKRVVAVDTELITKNSELKHKNAELELTLETIENERDFYFEKVRAKET